MKTNYDWCLETYLKSKPYIKNFRIAIDIGCRDGDYSLPLIEDFDKVHAFDYRPRMKYKNKKLTYYQVALGDISTEVKATGGVIKEDGDKFVQQKRLDDYTLSDVDYIKIDVEGHELKVLKGAIATIEKCNISMDDVALVGGYKMDAFEEFYLRKFKNIKYASTKALGCGIKFKR